MVAILNVLIQKLVVTCKLYCVHHCNCSHGLTVRGSDSKFCVELCWVHVLGLGEDEWYCLWISHARVKTSFYMFSAVTLELRHLEPWNLVWRLSGVRSFWWSKKIAREYRARAKIARAKIRFLQFFLFFSISFFLVYQAQVPHFLSLPGGCF